MDDEAPIERDLSAAIAGDRNALAQLLVCHAPRLSKRIGDRLRLNPFADFGVEDVVQEVFIDVVRGIHTFRIEDGTPFSAWVNKVADRRLAKMFQHRSRKKRGGDCRREHNHQLRDSVRLLVEAVADPHANTPSEMAHRNELIDAVRKELEELPDGQREAVETYFLDDRSLESTATELDKLPGAVRGLIHRAKRSMRNALGQSSRWFLRK